MTLDEVEALAIADIPEYNNGKRLTTQEREAMVSGIKQMLIKVQEKKLIQIVEAK